MALSPASATSIMITWASATRSCVQSMLAFRYFWV
jgi:hypothetical protein